MKFFINFVVSFLAVGGVATVVMAAASQQEVQHRLRGGVPASTGKNAEERRLGIWPGSSDLATDMNATSSSTSSDDMDDMNMDMDMDRDSNVTDSTSASASASASADASVDTTTTTTAASSSGDCASITETVCAMEGVTVFCELLQNETARRRRDLGGIIMGESSDLADDMMNSTSTDTTGASADDTDAMSSPTGASASASSDGSTEEEISTELGLDDDSNEFTLFVPTDDAFAEIASVFETLSDAEAGRVIMFHMYEGMMLTADKLECGEKLTSMNEMGDMSRTKCTGDKKYQTGNGNTKTGTMPEIDTADHMACNGVIHTLDYVMFPVSLSQLHSDDDKSASASASSDTTTTTGASSSEDTDTLSASHEFSADSDAAGHSATTASSGTSSDFADLEHSSDFADDAKVSVDGVSLSADISGDV